MAFKWYMKLQDTKHEKALKHTFDGIILLMLYPQP